MLTTTTLLVLLSSEVSILSFFVFRIGSSFFFFAVPIYDGRPTKGGREFTFTDADFSNITSWPQYEKGHQDLPYAVAIRKKGFGPGET